MRGVILLFAERLAFDLEVRGAAIEIVDFDRHGTDLQAQRGAGFVDQVDGLIGQEAVGDVAVREHGGGDDGGILDAHAVVDFEFLLEAAQNGDGVVDGRLADQHGAEAARQGGVLFDVLLVFVERGGADAAQFAARQRRLEQVGGVDRAFGRARADQGVQLVDEADDLAVGIDDFLDHGLEAVFEFAAELGAGDHAAEVDGHQLLVLELIGHVAADDALGEAFDDGGLADARFADQHRVVLGAAAEHLHDAADFVVAADHRIELALAGGFGEIVRVAFQRLIFGLRILVGDALRAAHGDQGLEDGVVGGAGAVQKLAGGVLRSLAMESSRCSVETNSSLKRTASSKACSSTGIERRGEIHAGLHVAGFGQGGEQARPRRLWRRGARRISPARAGRCPPSLRRGRSADAAGTLPGCRSFRPGSWHCCKASCAFWVNLSMRNIWSPRKHGAGEPTGFKPAPQTLGWRHRRAACLYRCDAMKVRCVTQMRQTVASTLICRGLAVSFLGSVTVRTPFLKAGIDLVGIERVGHGETAYEVAVAALDPVIPLVVALVFELAFAGDGQGLVFDAYVDVLGVYVGEVGFDDEFVLGLVDVDGRATRGDWSGAR